MIQIENKALSSRISLEKLSKALPVYSSRQIKNCNFRISGSNRNLDSSRRLNFQGGEYNSQLSLGGSRETISLIGLKRQESSPQFDQDTDRFHYTDSPQSPVSPIQRKVVVSSLITTPSNDTRNFFIAPSRKSTKRESASQEIEEHSRNTKEKTNQNTAAGFTNDLTQKIPQNSPVQRPISRKTTLAGIVATPTTTLERLGKTEHPVWMNLLKPIKTRANLEIQLKRLESPEERLKPKTLVKIPRVPETPVRSTLHEFNLQTINWEGQDFPELQEQISLSKQIGCGGFSKVFEGIYLPTGQPVAVKVIDKSIVTGRNWRKMVERELAIHCTLHHKNICEFYRMVETETSVCFVLELGKPESLSKVLARSPKRRFEESVAKRYFKVIVEVVEYLHSDGIYHRDLKLSNFIFSQDNELKLIDFGFADRREGKVRDYCGTLSYMAPELIRRTEYVGKQVDIWALGVLLFKMLSGHFPFGKEDDQDLRARICEGKPDYPESLSSDCIALLCGCFNTDPRKRFTIEQIKASAWLTEQAEEF